MTISLLKLNLNRERDAISSRRIAQGVADLAGLTARDKTRLATAVSEIARNALRYADGGVLECNVAGEARAQLIEFIVSDEGPGIGEIDSILGGEYRSRTGMGLGIHGSSKLVDEFSVNSCPKRGTTVRMAMRIPERTGRVTEAMLESWRGALDLDEESRARVEDSERDDVMRALKVLKLKEQELERQLEEARREQQELRAAQDSLVEQATLDALTGLMNRRSVMRCLDVELGRSLRSGRPLSVGIVDLDHFKSLNDSFGHLAGDAVLVETAKRMESVLRAYDSVGRYGGEEFIFVFPNCPAPAAATVCDRVRERISGTPMTFQEMETTVTASFGVSSDPAVASAQELVDLADAALYRAKEGGRDRVEISNSEDRERLKEARSAPPTGHPGAPRG